MTLDGDANDESSVDQLISKKRVELDLYKEDWITGQRKEGEAGLPPLLSG